MSNLCIHMQYLLLQRAGATPGLFGTLCHDGSVKPSVSCSAGRAPRSTTRPEESSGLQQHWPLALCFRGRGINGLQLWHHPWAPGGVGWPRAAAAVPRSAGRLAVLQCRWCPDLGLGACCSPAANGRLLFSLPFRKFPALLRTVVANSSFLCL